MDAARTLRAAALRHQPAFEAAYRALLDDLAKGPSNDRLTYDDLINPDVILPGTQPIFLDAWLRAIRAFAMDHGHLDAFQFEDEDDTDFGLHGDTPT